MLADIRFVQVMSGNVLVQIFSGCQVMSC